MPVLASAASILALAQTIMQGIDTASDLASAIIPRVMLLKQLFSGEKITVTKIVEIRAENDALNAELEAQTEEGK